MNVCYQANTFKRLPNVSVVVFVGAAGKFSGGLVLRVTDFGAETSSIRVFNSLILPKISVILALPSLVFDELQLMHSDNSFWYRPSCAARPEEDKPVLAGLGNEDDPIAATMMSL